MTTAYSLIRDAAAKLAPQGFLAGFKTDLTKHDAANLRGKTEPFLWGVRNHGTSLVLKSEFGALQDRNRQSTQAWIETDCDHDGWDKPATDRSRWFHFDGETLTELRSSNAATAVFDGWKR